MMSPSDGIDVREIRAALRRQRRWIGMGALAGLLLGLLAFWLVPPRYEATATVLLRSSRGGSSPSFSSSPEGGVSLGGLASVLSLDSGFETELEILSSRAVIGDVVDDLGLQAEVIRPRGWSVDSLFSSARFLHRAQDSEYHFERAEGGYRVEGPGATGVAVPGEPYFLGGSEVILRQGRLPDVFSIAITDFESAVARTEKALEIKKSGGEVAKVLFRASDPATTATVANALVERYLQRRKTTDRGVNQRRYEFLLAHTDSIEAELVRAERMLRQHQESSGVLDPEVHGEEELKHALKLRAQLQELQIESNALEQVLDRGAEGRLDARTVAAYPSLIHNPAFNHLLARLSDLEVRRAELIERRTPTDPDVLLLDRDIRQTEGHILRMARSFHGGIRRKLSETSRELAAARGTFDNLPAEVEKSLQLQRDVRRLSETSVALQTQLVQARLAAIAEGGDVRQVDVAKAPKRPLYPRLPLTVALGVLGGLFFSATGAIGQSVLSPRIREPLHAERISGLPVYGFDGRLSLLLPREEVYRTLMVVPIGEQADSVRVGNRLVEALQFRGEVAAFADLLHLRRSSSLAVPDSVGAVSTQGSGSVVFPPDKESLSGGEQPERLEEPERARALLTELEAGQGRVVAAAPPLSSSVTGSLLSADRAVVLAIRSGDAHRDELQDAIVAMRRAGVPVLGAVLHGDGRGR